jgi:hypothetical protein
MGTGFAALTLNSIAIQSPQRGRGVDVTTVRACPGRLRRKCFVPCRHAPEIICLRPRPIIVRPEAWMPTKKKQRKSPPKSTKVKPQLPSKLSKTEEDLLWHMGHGYQLETSSLGDNPILRRLKDNTEVRATANRRTIETLQQRGLITVAKAGAVFNPTVWRLTSKAPREVANDARRT